MDALTRRLRALFVHDKRRFYTRQEAADLLGMTVAEVEEERFEPERGRRVAWEEVAMLAMQDVPLTTIEAALGDDAATALPPMLRTVALTIRVPQYLQYELELMASDDAVDVGHILTREMHQTREWLEVIEATHPGVLAAARFPYPWRG